MHIICDIVPNVSKKYLTVVTPPNIHHHPLEVLQVVTLRMRKSVIRYDLMVFSHPTWLSWAFDWETSQQSEYR